MNKTLLIATLMSLGLRLAYSAEPLPMLTKTQALKAITLFRQDSLSDTGRGAGGLLMNFAEKSKDVSIKISPKVVPFLSNEKIPLAERSTLTAAFVVGNADSQLLRNNKNDDAYAGVLQVIETYRQMQKRKPNLRLTEVEKFIELEKTGKLKQYVASP